MSNIPTAETHIAAPCAVFKIDLKGRFVYIDDEVEELLGASLEELFGRSINEFISRHSRQTLEDIMAQHNRYESFYDALSLDVKLKDENLYPFDAVITLNFIAGNPVNYQVILLPCKDETSAQTDTYDRRFLELLNTRLEDVSLNVLAEIFCRIGGYSRADCYLPDDSDNLLSAGSYPMQDSGFAAPAYIELFALEPQDRFSYNPDDRALHEGFGDNRSEAVLFLNFHDNRLILSLQAASEYKPDQSCLDDLAFYTGSWNESITLYEKSSPYSEQFGLLGKIASSQESGLALVNDNFDVLYFNNTFADLLSRCEIDESLRDMTKIYEGFEVEDFNRQLLPFEESPFAKTVMQAKPVKQAVLMVHYNTPILIAGAPFEIDDQSLYVYTITPLPAEGMGPQEDKTFILSVAHDLRAPLITIDAFSRKLQANHSKELSEDGTFAVDCLVDNVDILKQMMSGIEEIARNKGVVETPATFSVSDTVAELLKQMKAQFPETSPVIAIPKDLPEVIAPKNKFTTVLRNLLHNSFKYTQRVKQPKISLSYAWKDDCHSFTISDNGPGVPAKYRQKIFEPFFRNPDLIEVSGTGIGLAVAQDIVTSWGGRIDIEDKKSNGLAISFCLPTNEMRAS